MTLASIPVSADETAYLAGLIGLPYAARAAGPDAFDCFNLFAAVQRRLFERELPWSDSFLNEQSGPRDMLEAFRWSEIRRMWPEVARPRHGDAVLMAKLSAPRHVGTWIDCGPGFCGVLHATDAQGVVLETLAQVRANYPQVSFARSAERTLGALAMADRTFLPHVAGDPVAVVVSDILNPFENADVIALEPGQPISQVLEGREDADSRWIIRGATPLLRRHPETGLSEFDEPVERGDIIWVLPPLPLGGDEGGSQVLASVLAIVVSIAAPWVATNVLMLSGMAANVAAAGIAIAAQMLISSLVPAPPAPAQLANPDPTYSFGRFGNQLRPGAPIPRPLGTMHRQPDLLARSWAEFENNDQLVHVLLCLGLGDQALLEFGIDDTPVWTAEGGYTGALEDIAHELILPGETPSLFPTAIDANPEVDGLELPAHEPPADPVTIGPFNAVASGQTASELVFDFVFPRGLFEFSGGEQPATVSWRIEALVIDDLGQAVGFWQLLEEVSYTAASTTPQRLTRRYPVERGRYSVRVTRISETAVSGTGAQDQLVWAGLKAKRTDVESYPNVTALAIRVRAGAASQAGLSNWYTVTRSILPHFDMATGEIVTGPTEQIDAAVLEVARAHHGLRFRDEDIDLEQLWSIAQLWHARGDVCCTALEAETTAWDALSLVLGAGRARASFVGSTLTFVRDGPRVAPTKVITPADMVRGSFRVERAHFLRDTPVAVNMIYRDRRGQMQSMKIPPDAPADAATAEFRSSVHVDAEQVWRDGNFKVAETLRRRVFVAWAGLTGAGALLPGELVAIAHPRPEFGAGGRIAARDGFELTCAFEHGVSQAEPGRLSLSAPDGGYWGSVLCHGIDPWRIRVDESDFNDLVKGGFDSPYDPDFRNWIVTEADCESRGAGWTLPGGLQVEPTRAIIGREHHETFRALIVDVQPIAGGQVEVLAVKDVPEVHEADASPMPPLAETAPALLNDARPVWEDVQIAGQIDTGATPNLADFEITGPAIPGAVRYFAEVSSGDSPADWVPVSEAPVPQITGPLDVPDAHYIRVAAAGPVLRGPWRVFVIDFSNALGGVTLAEFLYEEN